MLEKVKLYLLKRLYWYLIVNISTTNKAKIRRYDKLRVFGRFAMSTNRGEVSFVFKEEPKAHSRNTMPIISLTNYYVEFLLPSSAETKDTIFEDRVTVVVKIKLSRVNYKALGMLMRDIYLDEALAESPVL